MLAAKERWNLAEARGIAPSRRDLLLLGYLPVMALIAWVVPDATWLPICTRLARLSGRAGSRRDENTRRIARILSDRASPNLAARIAADIGAHHHHARLQLLRCYRSPAWRPAITLVGREHIDAALTARTGAVLWNAPFVYNNLVTKMALHGAGFAVRHLSGRQHGLSTSRFGQRFLNPIWTDIEDRFLAERALMTTAESTGALRQLMRGVKANQLVSIAMGPHGSRSYTAPFCSGHITLANGAPSLARRSGAALLPVFTVRTDDGSVVTTIEPPIHASMDVPTTEAEKEIVAHCVRVLESYVRRWPEQFDGWVMTDAQPNQKSPNGEDTNANNDAPDRHRTRHAGDDSAVSPSRAASPIR
jgi:lauroyl/myristoyl acyltransferase